MNCKDCIEYQFGCNHCTPTYTLVIRGRLPGMNEYTNANRRNVYQGAKVKSDAEHLIQFYILEQLKGVKIDRPCYISFEWYEPNGRRDIDNIISAKKFILDALQRQGVLVNDNQKHVKGVTDKVMVDANDPRVKVVIREERK